MFEFPSLKIIEKKCFEVYPNCKTLTMMTSDHVKIPYFIKWPLTLTMITSWH
jgi:hypothetical protein